MTRMFRKVKVAKLVLITMIAFFVFPFFSGQHTAWAKNVPDTVNQSPGTKPNSSATQQIAAAEKALLSVSQLKPNEGDDSNIVVLAQALVNDAATDVTVKLLRSENPMIAADGTIMYGDDDVCGSVSFILTKNKATTTVSLSVLVPESSSAQTSVETPVDPGLEPGEVLADLNMAQSALAQVGTLDPVEGIDCDINVMAQNLVDEIVSGVTIRVIASSNPQVSPGGAITYGACVGDGNVTLLLSKEGECIEMSVPVCVPINVTSSGINCTALGMIKNDPSKSQTNMSLLLQAVQEGKNVLVDGVYYLRNTDRVSLSNTNLSLTGIVSDAEFRLDGGNVFFNLADNVNVNISSINFTQFGSGPRFLLSFAPDCLANEVVIDGNRFSGDIRCLDFPGSTALNPAVTAFGIKELRFSNNQVDDVTISFMKLTDMPSDRIIIEGNIINNFDYTFIHSGITNDMTYKEEMYAAKKLMIVRNNYASCDDDWWGNTNNSGYYCFVLFEGIDVIYTGNHVEGLKFSSGSGSGAALYDSYLSCADLQYTDNIWKNNLNFNPGKLYNTLLKSKGGPNGIKRYYENNTYIVEKSFIESCSSQLAQRYSQDPAARLTQDLSSSWIDFISLTHDCSTYEIYNNSFDIYDLRLPESYLPVEQMRIEGNTFNCQRIGGSLLHFPMLRDVDYTEKMHTVRNNTINSKEFGPAGFFYLVRASNQSSDNRYGTIVVEHNVINAPCSYLLHNVLLGKAVVTDNIVTLTDPGFSASPAGISSSCNISDLIYEGNTILQAL